MKKKLLWIFLIIPLILCMFSTTMIRITVAQERDIAVVSVTPSPSFVKTGDQVNITVVVENQGTENETFDVTAYYDTTAIETKTNITLAADTDTSLTFTWDTTDLWGEVNATAEKEREYTINVTATTVPGETDTADNTLISPTPVTVISQYITVVPQSTVDPTFDIDMNYTVSIYTDYNGTDVWGYEFTLTYNPNVLHGVSVTNGDLITKAKDDSATLILGTFDNVNGKLSLTGASFLFPGTPKPLTSGPGILANVTFTVVDIGDSQIELGLETRLIGVTLDGDGDPYEIIDRFAPDHDHLVNGYFKNTLEEVIHDVAVVSVTPSNTSAVAGELVDIAVVVENQGTVNEDVEVSVYYNYDPVQPGVRRIGRKTAQDLEPNATKLLTYTWDTTDAPEGNHTIAGVVTELSGETDTEDNTFVSSSKVTITMPPQQPIPIELIIGIVVIIVVIVVVVYALRRRKKQPLE